MPAISQSPKSIFLILKSQITSLPHNAPQAQRTVLGDEQTHLIVDSFTASVPKSMLGEGKGKAQVTIEPTSTVDNRQETNDAVYFSAMGKEYYASESRYVDSDGGVVQTQYGLQEWDGSRWRHIDGLA